MQDKHKTMVVFRVWKRTEYHHKFGIRVCGGETISAGGVIALFPCKRSAGMLETLAFHGRHTLVNAKSILSRTRPATPEEAIDLADELKDIGYNLAVRQRRPSYRYEQKWRKMGNS